MMSDNIKLFVSVTITFLFVCVFGMEFTYDTSKAGAWGESESWSPNSVPGEGDTILIPANAYLRDKDRSVAENVAQIIVSQDATLMVENSSAITMKGYISGDGKLVKDGTGLLEFTKRTTEASERGYYLKGGIDIIDGILRFPNYITTSSGVTYFFTVGPINVKSPAVLEVPGGCNFEMALLTGDGTIRNIYGADAMTQLRPKGTSVFDGFLSGADIRVYTEADITFTCKTNSISYNEFATWGGRISFYKFGNLGEPSAPGPNAVLNVRDFGGTIRYLGEDEVTNRKFQFAYRAPGKFAYFDAGLLGGLTITGEIVVGMVNMMNVFVLEGENAKPVVVTGSLYNEGNGTACIVKQGSGTWYFKDSDNNIEKRKFTGVYEINDGVLQFDSIANTGEPCSLGIQTKLTPRENAHTDMTTTIDTSFVMGRTYENIGTLRYVGTNKATTDRKIGLLWKGRLENASDSDLLWKGGAKAIETTSTQIPELILAGNTSSQSVIADVCDGDNGRKLSVTKEGSGTWTFDKNTTFSGNLLIKEGTIKVGATKPSSLTWYKWTIRETGYGNIIRNGGTAVDSNVGARQLRFYDKDGNPLPMTDFKEDMACSVLDLNPNYMTYDGNVIQTRYSSGNPEVGNGDTGRNLNRLVDRLATEWLVAPKNGIIRRDIPKTAISIVFRFPEGTAEAAYYDVVSYAKLNGRGVSSWTMYGSSDGIEWVELDKQEYELSDIPDKTVWISDRNSAYPEKESVNGFDCALKDEEDIADYGIPNAKVEVAEGASLVNASPNLRLTLPRNLTVEAGKTHGSYSGFVVPQEGVIDVRVPLHITWFRLSILETVGGKTVREGGVSGDANVQMQEFGLFNSYGVRKNVGLTVDHSGDAENLQPGSVTFNKTGYLFYGDRDVDKLLDDARVGSGMCVSYNDQIRLDHPSSKIVITMRLNDNDTDIASYDWVGHYDKNYIRTVSSWRLEGSEDGKKWVTLDEKIEYADGRDAGMWWFDNTPLVSGSPHIGFPISFQNTESLISLKNFSATIDFSQCEGTSNFTKWAVTANGIEMPRVKMLYNNGTLSICPVGFIFVVR